MTRCKFSIVLPLVFLVAGLVCATQVLAANNTNDCKNFEKHMEQYGSYEEMPPGLQNTYSSCEGSSSSTPPGSSYKNGCEWVDDLGRSRKEWHKDVKEGKITNLYKRCYDDDSKDTYSTSDPHPGCKGITNAYEKQSSKKEPKAPGLTKNYNNCINYGTPYPQAISPDPSLDDLADNLAAHQSIQINSDALFSESQSVVLTMNPSTQPEKMQFSNNGTVWSDWETYGSTKDWLIDTNNAGEKKVYIRYKTGTTISEKEFDAIMLLPKYGATYSIANTPNSLAKGRTTAIDVTLKNTGFLTWDSAHAQYPVHLKYTWKDSNGAIIEDHGNYALFSNPIAYGQVETVTLLLRAPMQPGSYTVEIGLEESGVTSFSDAGVNAKSLNINVTDSPLPERTQINDVTQLPFGIGGYEPLVNEPTPETITVCGQSKVLYELSADQTVFTVEYLVPYGRSINNIHDLWIDTNDNTAFYEVDYSEYVNDSRHFFLYRDSAVESGLCPDEADQFPDTRPCEDLYPDVTGTTDASCLDIAKASAAKWVSGYQDGNFNPTIAITRAEFAKVIIGAVEIPLLAHPSTTVFNDIDPNTTDWHRDYAYTAYEAGIMTTDASGNFDPTGYIKWEQAIRTTLLAFELDVNACNYGLAYPGYEYIGAALYYGLVEDNKIPAVPTIGGISREYMVHVLVNAYAQKSVINATPPLCPNSAGDIIPSANTKEVCGAIEPVYLSSTSALTGNLGLLLNGTTVEVESTTGEIAKIRTMQTGKLGYVSSGDLSNSCDTPTPAVPLNEPVGKQVVIAGIMGMYAHTAPNVTSSYVDVNGDGTGNSRDIIPYNSLLTSIKSNGNWIYVSFTETNGQQKNGWVYNGFLALGPDVPTTIRVPKTSGTIDWAHEMTVDMRLEPDTKISSIIWETYEGSTVQIIEKHEFAPFYFVKIEVPSRDLSSEIIEENYARLYEGMADLQQLNTYAPGISGWIHEEFVREDGVNYATPLSYPFEYNSADAKDNLVTQIFFEEVMGKVHSGIDYELKSANVLATASGKVTETHHETQNQGLGNYITIKHTDGKYSVYGHLKEIHINEGQTVNQGDVIGVSGGIETYDAGSQKHHLHFAIYKNITDFKVLKALNPTKYIGNYNPSDSDICMKELVVNRAMRDGVLIADICNNSLGDLIGDFGGCAGFGDVGEQDPYCPAIEDAKDLGWIQGYTDEYGNPLGLFKPTNKITRTEAIKVVLEAAEIDVSNVTTGCFPDTNGHWGENYICYAKEQGWINGYPDGTFRPNNNVNFAELAKISLNIFGFGDSVSCWEYEGQQNWYEPYINFLIYNGVEDKDPGTILFRDYAVYLIHAVYKIDQDDAINVCLASPMSVHGPWVVLDTYISLLFYDKIDLQNAFNNGLSMGSLTPEDSILTFSLSNYRFGYSTDLLKDESCNISKGEFYRYLDLPGYSKEIGFPCFSEVERTYGDYSHSSILFSNGARFTINGNNEWLTVADIKAIMQNADYGKETPNFNDNFRYSTVLGTFMWHGNIGTMAGLKTEMTAYYTPYPNTDNGDHAALVFGRHLVKLEDPAHSETLKEYLEEMCPQFGGSYCYLQQGILEPAENDWIVSYLGYPLQPLEKAATFVRGGTAPNTKGVYQRFANGHIYTVASSTTFYTYYVPGQMAASYTHDSGGSSGPHGFPAADPIYDTEDNVLNQTFENGQISLITKQDYNGDYVHFVFHEYDYKYAPEDYYQGLKDQFFENEIYGLGINAASIATGVGLSKSKVLSQILDKVITKLGSKAIVQIGAKYVPVLGWGLLAVTGYITYAESDEMHRACTDSSYTFDDDMDSDIDRSYYCGRRDAIAMMVGLGYGLDNLGSKVITSVFSGLSKNARLQSNRIQDIIADVGDDNLVKTYKKVLRDDPNITKVMRNQALETMENLSDADIEKLLKNDDLLKKFVNKKSFGFTTEVDKLVLSPFSTRVSFKNIDIVNETNNIKLLNNIDGLGDEAAELERIAGIIQPNTKGLEAELFMQKLLGKNDNVEDWFALGTTRKTDIWDNTNNISHEIKMWKNNVSYSGLTKEQVLKDIELMKIHDNGYTPIWHFLESEPTAGLKQILEDNGIQYIIYSY